MTMVLLWLVLFSLPGSSVSATQNTASPIDLGRVFNLRTTVTLSPLGPSPVVVDLTTNTNPLYEVDPSEPTPQGTFVVTDIAANSDSSVFCSCDEFLCDSDAIAIRFRKQGTAASPSAYDTFAELVLAQWVPNARFQATTGWVGQQTVGGPIRAEIHFNVETTKTLELVVNGYDRL